MIPSVVRLKAAFDTSIQSMGLPVIANPSK
jgi:hypothetical protein